MLNATGSIQQRRQLAYAVISGYKFCSAPDQRAVLEPAYILGGRKLIPESINAVESVLRTELLDAILKFMADACVRHGDCTAELIIWHIMKQLILPPDMTMQKEVLTV